MTRTLASQWLLIALLVGCATGSHRSSPSNVEEIVLVHVPGAQTMAALIEHGQLIIESVTPVSGAYSVRGTAYSVDWDEARKRSTRASVRESLTVADGRLLWNGRSLELPEGTQMRSIWEAVRFRGWIVGLGRTSRTDAEAAQTPPFFASELFYFVESGRKVQLSQVLGAFPPADRGLLLLTRP